MANIIYRLTEIPANFIEDSVHRLFYKCPLLEFSNVVIYLTRQQVAQIQSHKEYQFNEKGLKFYGFNIEVLDQWSS